MIYIYAPFYNEHSNGIACMYELARILSKNKHDVRILCHENERYDLKLPEDIKCVYISKAAIPAKLSNDDIVIYPDTVSGNVLNAKNVIYWLLNKPLFLTGESINYSDTDILISYSNLINNELPQLFLMKDDRKLFSMIRDKYCHHKPTTLSIYFGKVVVDEVISKNNMLKKIIKKYDEINVITRLYPNDRIETLKQISESDLLISFDSLTNINYEATLLGTPVLMMNDDYNTKNIKYNVINSGMAYSMDDINTVREHIDDVYKDYCKWLDTQNEIALNQIEDQILMAKNVHKNKEKEKNNRETNKKVTEKFLNDYKQMKREIINIDFIDQIPESTFKIISKKINILSINDEEEKDYVTKSSFYQNYKTKWINEMYKKIPTSLTVKELLFLIVRKILRG